MLGPFFQKTSFCVAFPQGCHTCTVYTSMRIIDISDMGVLLRAHFARCTRLWRWLAWWLPLSRRVWSPGRRVARTPGRVACCEVPFMPATHHHANAHLSDDEESDAKSKAGCCDVPMSRCCDVGVLVWPGRGHRRPHPEGQEWPPAWNRRCAGAKHVLELGSCSLDYPEILRKAAQEFLARQGV